MGAGRRRAYGAAVVGIVGVAVAVGWAYLVEPFRVELTRHSLEGEVVKGLKVAHLSDLHTRGMGTRERRVLALLEAEKPDLIVVTGDLVADGRSEPARDLLARMRAPLGVWVVRGNWERWTPISDEKRFFEAAGVRLLENQGVALREDVWLLGLDDPVTGKPDHERALEGAPMAAFKIALFHAPDHFSRLAGLVHLALAGHTHGGQVRLPGIGPLWLPPGGERYVMGWYTENGSKLYVSRGVGTSISGARFLCRPEVAMIEIRPK